MVSLGKLVLVLAMAVFMGGTPAHAFSIQGNQILDANGTPIALQGATLSGLEYRCTLGGRYSVADFAAMKTWNMNVAKIPVNPHYYASLTSQSCDGTQATQWAYRRAVQSAVANAESQGLYVILTMLDYNTAIHAGEPAPDQYTNWTLADLAQTYGADHSVLLESFSEPHDISNDCWLKGCTVTDNGGVTYAAVGIQSEVDTVNRNSPTTILLLDSPNWSGTPGLTYSAGYIPTGNNIAYAAHIYDQVTNATDANWPATFGNLAQVYPVVATEFGDTTHNCDPAWLNRLMPYLAAHTDGMMAWAWDAGTSCSRPDLLSAWNGTPSTYGAPIHTFFTRGNV